MLEIKGLKAGLKGESEEILKGVDLKIGKGEFHIIFGPNGSGKSTLGKVLLNHFKFEKKGGKILFNGEDVSNLETFEIAKKGIFLSHQHPISVEGVSSFEILRTSQKETGERVSLFKFKKLLKEKFGNFGLKTEFLERDFNKGFSGGEQKKMEMIQMLSSGAKLAFLDEIDSGLDFDSLKIIANGINTFLKDKEKSVILITHSKEVLEYLKPDYFHIFLDGKFVKSGNGELLKEVKNKGYGGFGDS